MRSYRASTAIPFEFVFKGWTWDAFLVVYPDAPSEVHIGLLARKALTSMVEAEAMADAAFDAARKEGLV